MYLEILNSASIIYLSFALMFISYFILRDMFYRTKVFTSIVTYGLSKIIPLGRNKILKEEHEE